MKSKFLYWCYDIGEGTAGYTNSVEVIVYAYSEEEALKMVKDRIERTFYVLKEVLV